MNWEQKVWGTNKGDPPWGGPPHKGPNLPLDEKNRKKEELNKSQRSSGEADNRKKKLGPRTGKKLILKWEYKVTRGGKGFLANHLHARRVNGCGCPKARPRQGIGITAGAVKIEGTPKTQRTKLKRKGRKQT